MDVSNKAAPVIAGSVYDATKLANPYAVAVAGVYAYVASHTGDRLTIVDISDPRSPRITGSVYDATKLDGPWSVAVAGNYAYVGLWSNRFTVVDISNPANPVVVSSLLDPTRLAGVKSVSVSGNYAYAGLYYRDYLTVINISNPVAPYIAGTTDLRVGTEYVGTNTTIGMSNGGVSVAGQYAYMVGSKRLTVVDISNPLSPRVAGWSASWDGYKVYPDPSAQFTSPLSIIVSGQYGYTAASAYFGWPRWGENGFAVLNISSPASPALVASIADKAYFDTSNGTSGDLVAVSGNYAYVAGRYADRLTVVDISQFPAAVVSSVSSSASAPASAVSSPSTSSTSTINAPVISNVRASSITAASVVISWTTNELADSEVEYEYSSPAATGRGTASYDSAGRLVTDHNVPIGALEESTVYTYRVRSKNASGHLATSANYTFTTTVSSATASDTTPPVISGVQAAASSTPGTVTVTWTTNEASDSQVEYEGPSTTFPVGTSPDPARVTSHSVTLSGLSSAAAYTYRVKSKDAAGNPATSADQTFTTPAAVTDTGAPTISNVYAIPRSSTSITITWDTDEISDSQVEYVLNASYRAVTSYDSATALNTSMVTNHSATITGMIAGNYYHFRVKSKDAAGNSALSPDYIIPTDNWSTSNIAEECAGVLTLDKALYSIGEVMKITFSCSRGIMTSTTYMAWRDPDGIDAYITSMGGIGGPGPIKIDKSTSGRKVGTYTTRACYYDPSCVNNTGILASTQFTLSAPPSSATSTTTATTTSVVQRINALASLLQSISQLLQQLKKLSP